MTDLDGRMPTAAERARAKRLVAQYDYAPTLEDGRDMQLVAGDVVFGVERQGDDGDWWWGYNSKRSGIFPASYVELDEAECDDAEEEAGSGGDEEAAQDANDDESDDSEEPPPPPSPCLLYTSPSPRDRG